ncbi:MAG: Gfo/Idh/MocA family oxidoreductase [Patescibacteria group bacterium]|nr:Gfo/Idh/MocA family oxidoreductase [Patescibacteria group bacterium]
MKIGIIGTGFGKMIGLNFKAVDPLCQIYFFSRDKEKAKTACRETGCQGTFDTWQELVQSPGIDLVVIASPSYLHKEMFEFVAKNKKAALIEKPAAVTTKDMAAMMRCETGELAVVNHEGRFHPVVSYIKDLVAQGRLGEILTARIGAYLNWYTNPEYKGTWNDLKKFGGGQLLSLGTHQIDLARFVLGMPKIKSGSVQTRIFSGPRIHPPAETETQFSAHFLTENKTSIQLFNDTYCFGYKNFTIDVIGSNGTVIYSDLTGLKITYSNNEPLQTVEWVDPLPEIKLGNSILTKSMKYMAKALIESISDNKPNPNFCTLEQARDNLEILERFKQ